MHSDGPREPAQSPERSQSPESPPQKVRRRCNRLDGKRWIQNSISVWSDIRKTPEEARLKHPAMFPQMLAERLIESFLPPEGELILDPFCGSGTTLLAAQAFGCAGVGLELSDEYVGLSRRRLAAAAETPGAAAQTVHHRSAEELLEAVEPQTVDLCITSPPYWNILNQRRTADLKAIRHYGNLQGDLGVIADYEAFLTAVTGVLSLVLQTLKPRAYCCVIVMDLRKKNRFFPFHSDLASRAQEAGFLFDDLIIWNRQSEYNNLRPLGYPAVFRINKVHEYVLILQKPDGGTTGG